jgi:hypothetical protein
MVQKPWYVKKTVRYVKKTIVRKKKPRASDPWPDPHCVVSHVLLAGSTSVTPLSNVIRVCFDLVLVSLPKKESMRDTP